MSRVETFGTGRRTSTGRRTISTSGAARPRFQRPARRRAVRRIRDAAGRRAQRPQRAGGDRRRDRGRHRAPSGSRAGLRSFAGVKRRLEVVGTADGVTVYDDFAHHPTAVAETLAGLRAANPDARIWAVFEPRSASSCRRIFQDDFARAFAAADRSADRAGVPLDAAGGRAAVGAAAGARPRRPRHVGARGRLDRRHRRRHRRASIAPGDLVVIMSNGGFGGIHQKLLRALERRRRAVTRSGRPHRAAPATPRSSSSSRSGSIRRSTRARSRWPTRFRRRRSPASATWCRPTARWRCTSIRCEPTTRALVEWLERQARPARAAPPIAEPPSISVPVCYGGELGPDLAAVAAFADMSPQDVIAIHARATYRVFMLGFMPGLCVPGRRRSAHRDAAPLDAARARAARGRSASPASRPASIRRDAGRLAAHRPDAAQAVRSDPAGAVPVSARAMPSGSCRSTATNTSG